MKRNGKRDLQAIAEELGYHFAGLTMRGHLKWHHPSGMTIITGSSLKTDHHLHNAIAELRRHVRQLELAQPRATKPIIPTVS